MDFSPKLSGGGPIHEWKPGKILGQQVNVKFFTVDPYSVGTGVPRTLLEWGKIQYKIKAEKNI